MAKKGQKFSGTANEAPGAFYDILRDKADEMGYDLADMPDEEWDRQIREHHKRNPLRESKTYIESYMLGKLDPSTLAQIMAQDDKIRYTISDICRQKLEPADLDIQHNGGYIDIGAGLKTFWTEIRMPLPSEVEAARDLRNIYFGVEAGKAAAGQTPVEAPDKAKKKSLRERIHDGRVAMGYDARSGIASLAQKIADKVTPDKPNEDFETIMERLSPNARRQQPDQNADLEAYNAAMQRRAAQKLENLAEAVELSKDGSLHHSQRMNALLFNGVSKDSAKEIANATSDDLFSARDAEAAGVNEAYRSGYTAEELSSPVNDEIAELLDQISRHTNYRSQKQNNGQESDSNQDISELWKDNGFSKNYIYGEFEGKPAKFKKSWSDHTFTDEEVSKLFAGESISFMHTDRNNKEKEITGKLDWQEFGGHKYLGFHVDYHPKKTAAESDQSGSPKFESVDELAEMGYEDPILPADEVGSLFDNAPDMEAEMAAYENLMGPGLSTASEYEYIDLSDDDLPDMNKTIPLDMNFR